MNKFTMLGHWENEKFTYELQIENGDKLDSYSFKSPLGKNEKITTLQSAKDLPCKCIEMGNIAGVSRLYGQFSESVDRNPSWLDFEGVTKDTKEVYLPIEKGKVEVIHSDNGIEFNFHSDKISGRWLMRQIPNIFDNEFIEGENMQLFWKPDTKETQMSQKLENMKLIKPEALDGEKTKVKSMMQSNISVSSNSKDFDVIVAAEGTWIDKFGVKFTYTKEFINTLFTNMNMQILEGTIPIGVDKNHSKIDDGKMTSLQLLDEPIAHIRGRGFFNGNIGDVNGASIDAELDAVFVKDFQSWFPVNGVTKRVSLVANPACKVCFFIPKT